jgi:hypothetical protein
MHLPTEILSSEEHHKQEGGETMKYAKPEVVLLAPAVEAVQGTTSKPVGNPDAAKPHQPSPAAYEADE